MRKQIMVKINNFLCSYIHLIKISNRPWIFFFFCLSNKCTQNSLGIKFQHNSTTGSGSKIDYRIGTRPNYKLINVCQKLILLIMDNEVVKKKGKKNHKQRITWIQGLQLFPCSRWQGKIHMQTLLLQYWRIFLNTQREPTKLKLIKPDNIDN